MLRLLLEKPSTEPLIFESLDVVGNLELISGRDFLTRCSKTLGEFCVVFTDGSIPLNNVV